MKNKNKNICHFFSFPPYINQLPKTKIIQKKYYLNEDKKYDKSNIFLSHFYIYDK